MDGRDRGVVNPSAGYVRGSGKPAAPHTFAPSTNFNDSIDASAGLSYRPRASNQTLSLQTTLGRDGVTGLVFSSVGPDPQIELLELDAGRLVRRIASRWWHDARCARLPASAPASVARLHAVLRRALNEAMRLDLIARNPATLVTAPRAPRTEQQALTPEQVRMLLSVAEGHPLQAFFTLLLMTGMRRGEALALHWADVHMDEGYADVKYTLEHSKGGSYAFAPPKTERSRRRVPLNATAAAALRRHRAQQVQQRLAMGEAWRDEDLVFTDTIGRALRGNHILQRQFKPLLKQAGLPAIRLHDLRHSTASLLAYQGVHVTTVSRLLGHSSTSMTLDIYSHVFPDAQRDATATLDGLVGVLEGQEEQKDQNGMGK